jgi:hypothetical protein
MSPNTPPMARYDSKRVDGKMDEFSCSVTQLTSRYGFIVTDVQGSPLLINGTTIDVDKPQRYPHLSDFVVRLWRDLLSVSVLQRSGLAGSTSPSEATTLNKVSR